MSKDSNSLWLFVKLHPWVSRLPLEKYIRENIEGKGICIESVRYENYHECLLILSYGDEIFKMTKDEAIARVRRYFSRHPGMEVEEM
ncbi:MAG: hypothetical protein WC285_06590 [Candidatus Gracilibacteria bacterium]|jgi:hypothetical protein